MIVTITANGKPFLICGPDGREDLAAFLEAAQGIEKGAFLRARPANDAETMKWKVELANREARGEDTSKLFGIQA